MNIASRIGAWAKSGGGIPYVSDGLVAWFDGIWNLGVGRGDDSLTVTDLVGGWSGTLGSGWTRNGFAFDGVANAAFSTGVYFPMREGVKTTMETCGTVLDKPTNADNTSGDCPFNNVGIFAYRGTATRNCGGIVGSVIVQSDGKVHYYAGDSVFSSVDHNNYDFARSYTRSAAVGRNVDAPTVLYLNGVPLLGVNTMSYVDTPSSEPTPLTFPSSSSCRTRTNCIRVYSRKLTADEIAFNAAIDRERFGLPAPEPQLLVRVAPAGFNPVFNETTFGSLTCEIVFCTNGATSFAGQFGLFTCVNAVGVGNRAISLWNEKRYGMQHFFAGFPTTRFLKLTMTASGTTRTLHLTSEDGSEDYGTEQTEDEAVTTVSSFKLLYNNLSSQYASSGTAVKYAKIIADGTTIHDYRPVYAAYNKIKDVVTNTEYGLVEGSTGQIAYREW